MAKYTRQVLLQFIVISLITIPCSGFYEFPKFTTICENFPLLLVFANMALNV